MAKFTASTKTHAGYLLPFLVLPSAFFLLLLSRRPFGSVSPAPCGAFRCFPQFSSVGIENFRRRMLRPPLV
jgi:hypothetical protein